MISGGAVKFCSQCGARLLLPESRFCSECGARLFVDGDAGSGGSSETQEDAQSTDVSDEVADMPPYPYSWRNLMNNMSSNGGAVWYEQYAQGGSEDLLEVFPFLDEWVDGYAFVKDFIVARPFGLVNRSDNDLPPAQLHGEEACLDLTEHPEGERLLDLLDDADLEYHLGPESKELAAVFTTGAGPVMQFAHMYRTPSGAAVLQWSSNLLACWADRDLSNPTKRFLLSRLMNVPAVLQAAYFLAETPFPSTATWFALPRESALSDLDLPLDQYPRPCIEWIEAERAVVPQVEGGDVTDIVYREAPPWIVRGAYAISMEMSDEQLLACVKLASDAFSRMHEMIADGIEEGEAQEAAPFHVVFASDPDMDDADVFYVPMTLLTISQD